MSLETTELSVGGVKFRGIVIAVVFSIVSSVSGGVWWASKQVARFEQLETTVNAIKMPDGEPLVKLIEQVDTLEKNHNATIAKQSDLEAVSNKHTTELGSMKTLIESNDVAKLQGSIASLKTTVDGVSVFTRDVQSMRESMVILKRDVDDQWKAIDQLGAGSLKGK
jgi:hypothetical protein